MPVEIRPNSSGFGDAGHFRRIWGPILRQFCPTSDDLGQFCGDLSQIRLGLHNSGTSSIQFGRLRPTWANLGPKLASTMANSANLGRISTKGHTGCRLKLGRTPPDRGRPTLSVLGITWADLRETSGRFRLLACLTKFGRSCQTLELLSVNSGLVQPTLAGFGHTWVGFGRTWFGLTKLGLMSAKGESGVPLGWRCRRSCRCRFWQR